jgi:putative ABC transport system ATP-binding protein
LFLDVKSLTKKYKSGERDSLALDGVTFSADTGEVCVIFGPSGSGKSTLMNIIGGIESATSGSVTVDGIEITNKSSRALIEYRRKYVGFVFQFYNLIPNLTIRENIEICARLGDDPLDMDVLMAKTGVKDQEDKFPSQLSGGQQQRVAIARALVKNPKILLCDEPTGALDYKTSKDVLKLFEEINRAYRVTIVMITHNEALKRMATRVVRVKDGKALSAEVNENVYPVDQIVW